MKLIAITTPDFRQGEDLAIRRLIDCGWHRVHIRKPEATREQLSVLIERIPVKYRPQISLHDHLDLAVRYGLGGVHLNSRNPLPPAGWEGLISRSCHSIEEIKLYSCLDYLTLSPIYDSFSKPGYKGSFTPELLKKVNLKNVYALGGVTLSRLSELEQSGFGGAAMLSEAWKPRMETLQYITHTDAGIEEVLRGGCRWVQLRMKDASDDEVIKMADKIIPICRKYDATFILDDRVHLVGKTGADGVHLGKKDMPVRDARKILGAEKIIGATANTEEDMTAAYEAGADYIGLGPFRFTTTKKGLSPVLGIEGCRRIMEYCRSHGINIPVAAIGGILIEDLPALLQTGVNGIAVSGLLFNSQDKENTTKEILRIWTD
ncbi:MAG: thiamine phosphate synthase [Muribaculaceae bacterium]|nr:thiamine phosphate synthase [Muribaculaceae bacterium]